MPQWGELFGDLKKKKHFPKDSNYVDHIILWVKKHVFEKNKLSCTEKIWVRDFAEKFKKQAKALWVKNSNQIAPGKSGCDDFLTKIIDVVIEECPCNTCNAMEVDDPPEVNPSLEIVHIERKITYTLFSTNH